MLVQLYIYANLSNIENKKTVAEKAFRHFRDLASAHQNIQFIAVSQSEKEHTDEWLTAVGGDGKVKVVTDPEREIFAQWGLGIAGWGSILSPTGIMDTVSLAWNEGIKNRPTQSGNRWQTAGSFAVDNDGGERVVKWVHVSDGAGDISKFEEALKALGVQS